MTAAYMSTALHNRPWLVGFHALLLLTACASTQPEKENAGAVDVGYGEVDEDHVEGSIETVDGEKELSEGAGSMAEMLRGVPGLRVRVEGDDLAVRIRGSSSFFASEAPLVVIDNMEYRGTLRNINPYDIDSIRVLKNAGETAVYGSRGANGVILITTKNGHKPMGG